MLKFGNHHRPLRTMSHTSMEHHQHSSCSRITLTMDCMYHSVVQLVLLIVWLAPLHIHSVFELITSGSVYCRQIPSYFSLFSPAFSPFPFIRKKELWRYYANCAHRRRFEPVFFFSWTWGNWEHIWFMKCYKSVYEILDRFSDGLLLVCRNFGNIHWMDLLGDDISWF